MGQVTIGSQELQNNVSPLNAEVMIELLQRIAAAANAIDSDQINPKAILEAALGDGAVSLRTLSAGIMRYDTCSITGIGFENIAYRIPCNTFREIMGIPDPANKLEIEIIPPQDCYGQFTAKIRFDHKAELVTKRLYLDIFDTVSGTSLLEYETDPLNIAANVKERYSLECSGVCELNAGQTYRIRPRFKWTDLDTLNVAKKSEVMILGPPKNTHLSALLLPRTT